MNSGNFLFDQEIVAQFIASASYQQTRAQDNSSFFALQWLNDAGQQFRIVWAIRVDHYYNICAHLQRNRSRR